jgi:hypothetical protein
LPDWRKCARESNLHPQRAAADEGFDGGDVVVMRRDGAAIEAGLSPVLVVLVARLAEVRARE